MILHRRFFHVVFVLMTTGSVQLYAQDSMCDSSGVLIKTNRAREIALSSQSKRCFDEKSEYVYENGICLWKITIASMYSTKHHGYYSRDYWIIWIDSETGTIVKQEAHKRLEEKYE